LEQYERKLKISQSANHRSAYINPKVYQHSSTMPLAYQNCKKIMRKLTSESFWQRNATVTVRTIKMCTKFFGNRQLHSTKHITYAMYRWIWKHIYNYHN